MRRIHVVALVALSSSGTESFVLLAGRGARWSTRPATATTLSSEERFAEELQGLPSAVDQLRAIDANGDGLGTTAPFAVVLATAAASDAPAAAVAALVGHVMARVKRAGVAVDDALLTALAPALLRARKDAECLAAVGALSARTASDVRCGVAAAARSRDDAQLRAYVAEAAADEDTLKTLDDASLKAAMRGLAKKGDHRTAYSLLDALPAERRSPLLYHGAITACGRSRPIKGRTAMLLWRRMKEENVTVPRATYNALLHAAQGSLTENATSALLAAMDRDGVALNVVSYNVALNSLAKQGRFSEVLSLLEAMESASIKPTEVTFGTAINGAARANNSAAAVALLGAQTSVGLPLGDPAFASALEACLNDPDTAAGASRAAEVLDALAAADVSLKRRERVEELARAAISRNRAAVDDDRLKRDEDILGMVLQNRRVEV
ncbi:unnamed protein product [Pelagomonas calceolata]|uniref:Pentacotripeptide-repeat region of PRORP domain-containing protein n=1 Tax=Pelagomonas calceolata TaxID=35677 RepID=A0A8J2SRY0_9STRA|nr:unnamed protein product [Pelagomonas calceolata]|mmetsp:Transcript_2071/g.6719  ORF Transcript_2071/g.6719 Transcript_2071/m.6719 type:complete len:439 (+) Transcript_2071:121-1437(+)